MTSFILWRRDQGGNLLAFYGEPRHLTGLPPSPPVIFNRTEGFKRRVEYIFPFILSEIVGPHSRYSRSIKKFPKL